MVVGRGNLGNAQKKGCFFSGKSSLGRKPSKAALLTGRVASEWRKYIFKGARCEKGKIDPENIVGEVSFSLKPEFFNKS